MLIPLSIGDLRIACAGARAKAIEEGKNDRAKAEELTYTQLLEGAIHNGLKPSDTDKKDAREMAQRDVEHAMADHISGHYVRHIDIMLAMADFVDKSDSYAEAIIDSTEFTLLKDHLPAVPASVKD